MPDRLYDHFDLLLERYGRRYQARILSSAAGEAARKFARPISAQESNAWRSRMDRPLQASLRSAACDALQIRGQADTGEAARRLGGRLFRAVFAGSMENCLRTSMAEARRRGRCLRINLRLSDAPQLAELPWEYLYDPRLNRFLALSSRLSLVRYLELPEPIRPLAINPPLKVLVVVSNPDDRAPLEEDAEWSMLKQALGGLESRGRLSLTRLEAATLPRLEAQLRQQPCHILHFIGHGGFDQERKDGYLVFADGPARSAEVGCRRLSTLLHDHTALRLVVLNACDGGRASPLNPFAGVAQNLIQQRVPAVVGMQYKVTNSVALTFAERFYAQVVEGFSIDAAVSRARKAIYLEGQEVAWASPVLYMRARGRLFQLQNHGSADSVNLSRMPGPLDEQRQTASQRSKSRAVLAFLAMLSATSQWLGWLCFSFLAIAFWEEGAAIRGSAAMGGREILVAVPLAVAALAGLYFGLAPFKERLGRRSRHALKSIAAFAFVAGVLSAAALWSSIWK